MTAPIPGDGDPRGSYPYFTDPAPVRITVSAGWWRFLATTGADDARAVTAQLLGWPAEDGEPPLIVSVARPSLADLEQTLGFPLPQAVGATLASSPPRNDLVLPGPFGGWQVAQAQLLLDIGLDWDERPWRASRVDLAGHEPATYGRLLHVDPPLRIWQHDPYRVDIVSATPGGDGLAGGGHALTYRVCLNGDVIFAGQDALIPAESDPRSDDAVRRVIDRVIDQPWDRGEASFAQQSFLDVNRERLALRALRLTPPYSGGTRILVDLPGGLTATGVVRGPVVRGGRTAGYLWRPDVADLPGHPGHRRPDYVLYADAERVRDTLAGQDTAVDGPDGPVVLTFGATIATVDDPRFDRGTVLRAVDDAGRLAYDVQPIDDPRVWHRLDVHDVIPLTGTAWPTIDRLLLARDIDRVPLIPGEILVAVREVAVMPDVDPPVAGALVREALLSADRVLDPDAPFWPAHPAFSDVPQAADVPGLPPVAGATGPPGIPSPRLPEPPEGPGFGAMGPDL